MTAMMMKHTPEQRARWTAMNYYWMKVDPFWTRGPVKEEDAEGLDEDVRKWLDKKSEDGGLNDDDLKKMALYVADGTWE